MGLYQILCFCQAIPSDRYDFRFLRFSRPLPTAENGRESCKTDLKREFARKNAYKPIVGGGFLTRTTLSTLVNIPPKMNFTPHEAHVFRPLCNAVTTLYPTTS